MAKPEPLKGKIHMLGFAEAPNFESEDIRSAVEWYKKYQDNNSLFFIDYPYLYKDYIKSSLHYRVWLLDKAFEDVMKK